ncbi:MAG: uroporphyrinogen decarboxylase family protein [Candidatus Sigynarchaeota archaeon]
MLSFRERILKTFAGERVESVVWQPRIRFWYTGNNVQIPLARQEKSFIRPDPTIPADFFGMDMLEVHDALGASIRYCAETLGIGLFAVAMKSGTTVKSSGHADDDGTLVTVLKTPVGSLTEKHKGGYPVEHLVKNVEDLEIMKYIIGEQEFTFNPHGFQLVEEVLEGRGIAQAYYKRSPFMSCVLNYLGFETTVLFLKRYRQKTEEFMRFIGEWEDKMYDILVDCPVKILNFGENIDANLVPPRYFKEYCIPYYNRRIKQLHDAGKYCHIHMDGSLKDLLPLVKDTHFDGVEAATPVPQGDVTIEEIKEGLGDKVLLDGIPATLFMKEFPESRLEDTTRRLIELFGSRLILGVSDELPPNGQIGRFKIVSKVVEEMKPR